MSTTIDQRVVEMRFENRNFEKNVATSMSTLDKLKQKLNLTGASKGLDQVNAAAKNVDMSGLGRSVETVSAKFSAMQVIGTTALVNLTNSAMAAGKRMLSALTIDPVKTGFSEYETQINSTQTILANTASKGSTIKDVNKALEELNTYADKTIYNFTEMTRNIGTFTAAGIDLDTSVNAIQGIANLAAVSGSTSQQASTAMYQLSQALAAGTVKLMDWNSVVNAGMGGEMFQNALKETSKLLGTGAEEAIKASGSFRESLKDGWLTSEVLTETLKKFTTSGANEYIAEYTGLSKEAIEAEVEKAKATGDSATAMDRAAEAIAKMSGKSKDEIKTALEFAQTAEDAATKVKTFTQLWDVMKESAQSGWSQSWKIIIGDFEQAKALLTPLADFATGIINKMSETRNAILESALGKSFSGMVDNIKKFINPIKNTADSVKDMVKTAEQYAAVVDEIIGNKWGNGQERWDALAKAGYDWAHAQNLVNERLGCAKRHATNYSEAQNNVAEAQEKSTEASAEYIAELTNMSEAELKALGYSDDQIKSLKELKKTADQLGLSVEDLVKNVDQINGRWLIIESFKNAGKGLVSVFQAVGQAWREAFHGDATDEEILNKRSEALFNIIAAVHKFSTKLVASEDTVEKITRTFKGLFAVLDILTTIVGGGFKIAFKVLSSILGYFNLDLLDLTAVVGDALVKFRDWFDSLFDVSGILDVIVPPIKRFVEIVKELFAAFKASDTYQNFVTAINSVFTNLSLTVKKAGGIKGILSDFFTNLFGPITKLSGISGFIEKIASAFRMLTDSTKAINLSSVGEMLKSAFGELKNISLKEVGVYIWDGLILGLFEGAKKVITTIITVAKNLIDSFCAETGVESPSKVFMAIGGFIIAGLILGLKDGLISVPDALKGIVDKCLSVIQNVNWGAVFAFGVSVASIMFIKKVGDALEAFSAPFAGIGDILENVADAVKTFDKVTKKIGKAVANNLNSKALKNMAISIAILVGAVLALTLLVDDPVALWNAVGVIATLAVVMVGLAWATNQLSKASVDIKNGKIDGLKTGLLTLATAMVLMGVLVKIVGGMNTGQAIQGFVGIVAMMGAMLGFLYISKRIIKGDNLENVERIGSLMIRLSVAMLLMIGVAKLASKLEWGEMGKAAIFAAGFAAFVWAIGSVAKKSNKDVSKLGGMLVKISIAMLLMIGVIKLVDLLTVGEMLKGVGFAAAFALFLKALVKASSIGNDKKIAKLGGLLLSISISMGLMVGVLKLVDKLTVGEILKGALFAAGFVLFVKALVKILTVGNETQIAKVSGTILMMSVAIGVMAAVAMMLSLLDLGGLAKGVVAVGILGSVLALMIYATRGANDIKGNLIVMSVAIALMAAAVAGLSFIEPKKLAGAVAAMSILMGMFALITYSTKYVQKSMGTIIVMTIAIAAIAGVLWMMSVLDVQNALTNATALSLLLLAVSGSMMILSKLNVKIGDALKGALGLTLMAVPMLAFIQMLSKMNGIENATSNTILLSGLMTAMSVLLAVVSVIGKFLGGGTVMGILGLTAMVIPLIVFAYAISKMPDISGAKENIIMLTQAMTVMTVLLAVLAVVGLAGPAALIGVGSLIVLIAAIGAFVVAVGWLLDKCPEIEGFLNKGIPLLVKLAEGIGLMIGSFIGNIAEGISNSLVVIGEDIVSLMDSLKKASEHASGIDPTSFDGVKELLGVLADIGKTMVGTTIADIFTLGGTSMEKFETDGVAFFGALKAISEKMVGFQLPENFSSESVTALVDAISAVGKSTVGTTFADIFTLGGTSMEKFEADGKSFFTAIKGISESMTGFSFPENFSIDGLTTLIDAIKTVGRTTVGMTFADIFSAGGTSMEKFEADGKAFFRAVKAISSEMVGFSFPENFSTKGLTTLLDTLKTVGATTVGMTFADIFSGGGTSMEKFEADGKAFFQAAKAISTEMVGFTFPENFSLEGLTTLLDTIKTIGNHTVGTSWSDIFTLGGTSMEKFQTDGVALFSAIKAISTEASGITTDSFGLASTAIDKIKQIFESVKGIDYSGVEEFTGIGTGGFGADGPMHDIGVALKDFGTQVSGLDPEVVSTASIVANKIRLLIANLVSLDTSGIENFKAKEVGTAIKDYSNQVKDIDPALISSSITSATRLKTFIGSLVDLDSTGVANFRPGSIGSALKLYANSVSEIDTMALMSSIGVATRLKNFIVGLVGIDTSGVASYKTAIDTLGSVSLDKFIQAFSVKLPNLSAVGGNMINSLVSGIQSKQSSLAAVANGIMTSFTAVISSRQSFMHNAGSMLLENLLAGMNGRRASIISIINGLMANMIGVIQSRVVMFKEAGSTFMIQLGRGISNGAPSVVSAVAGTLTVAIASMRNYGPSFYSAGSSLVDGFAAGISENSWKAAAKASAMASAALEAAKEALGIASPSKEFYEIGDYANLGFVNALRDGISMAYNAGTKVAESARSGLSEAINKVKDYIDSDIDVQPTIRPVLDLSDVRAGANSIGNLFGSGATIGMNANIGAVSSLMNSRQNGANSDVVSAINKLRKDISGLGGDTYQINGITYDDGSAIANAIAEITRTALMERRI